MKQGPLALNVVCNSFLIFNSPSLLMSKHVDSRKPVSRDYAMADTDPQAPAQKYLDPEEENDGSTSPRKRLSRVVGKGVDNISKSFTGSGRSTPKPHQTTDSPPSPGPRRLFSLNRKAKGKERSHGTGYPDSKGSVLQNQPLSLLLWYLR